MEDRETPRMRKYGKRKTTWIIMATVPHVTAWAGHMKYHTDGFLLDWVYIKGNYNYAMNKKHQKINMKEEIRQYT